jgi:hypothetical protein
VPGVQLSTIKYIDDRTEGQVAQTINVNKLEMSFDVNDILDTMDRLGVNPNVDNPVLITDVDNPTIDIGE